MASRRLRLASGGIVDAIKRYDRNIRIRWSNERRKWCVEAKAKQVSNLTPPVWYVPVPGVKGAYTEKLKPENSDHAIAWHDGYYPIMFVSEVTWDVYHALLAQDTHRYANRDQFLDRAVRKNADAENRVKLENERERAPLVDAAYDKFKWMMNKPEMNPIGGGI